MAEFDVKTHPDQHLAYIRKDLYKILGPKFKAVTGRAAVVLFSEETKIEDVLRSIELIQADLQHALQLESHRVTKSPEVTDDD